MIEVTASPTSKVPKVHYPCIMQHSGSGTVWLMTSKGAGTALLPGPDSAWTLGETSQALLPDSFYHYTGEVTLRNKE